MVNCRARLYKGIDELQGGQRVAVQETLLHESPAYLSAPRRSWEQLGAVEGGLVGVLHVRTQSNLATATRVVIDDHALAGSYYVVSARLTDRSWALTLERRP
jgi:hypothetical protein